MSFNQLPQPIVAIKPLKGPMALVPDQQNILVVKFIPGGLDKLINESSTVVPLYYNLRHAITLVPSFDDYTIDKIVKYSPELDGLRYEYSVAPDICNQTLLDLANELQRLDYVEYCDLIGKEGVQPDQYLLPEPGPSLGSVAAPVPANTPMPDFTMLQGYIGGGSGQYVRPVWLRGISGRNINVLMRDRGVFPNHEDLRGLVEISAGTGPDHGTSSAGVMMARDNGIGMRGIAYEAGIRSYNNQWVGMTQIAAQALPGDVVSMSLGTGGLPLVHDRLHWDYIRRLVNSNVLVVISASNAARNLDAPNSGFQDHGDSGVIIVGACHPQTGERLPLSNYNVRNIVNAWGQSVATCGGGDLFNPGTPNRTYTGQYNGTSSAAPMIAGVLVLMQSHAKPGIAQYWIIGKCWPLSTPPARAKG